MCVNGKMRPVETILRRGEGIKENDEGVNLRYTISTFVYVTIYHGHNNNRLIKIRYNIFKSLRKTKKRKCINMKSIIV
jgi:hypothetical protein